MGIFGWSYPPGAENDPNAPYNQTDEEELEPTPELKTDPYGSLEFAIGSGDDFVCFDYDIQGGMIRLHAVLNSETGHFIEDFLDGPVDMPISDREAVHKAALGMIDRAIDWCYDNEVRIDKRGWNQDSYYFLRAVELAVRTASGETLPTFSERQKRFGGKRIQKLTGF